MAEQIIITIGREFGSGGHEIAEKLSKLYGIKLYDRNILQNIAEAKNVDIANYEKYDEVPRKMMFSRTVKGLSNSMEENIAQMQFRYLEVHGYGHWWKRNTDWCVCECRRYCCGSKRRLSDRMGQVLQGHGSCHYHGNFRFHDYHFRKISVNQTEQGGIPYGRTDYYHNWS